MAADQSKKSNRFRLEIISGSLKGTIYPIQGSQVVIGRAVDAGIHIDDNLISRRHCMLDYVNGYWFIEDLKSTNGTWLVGQKLSDHRAYLPINTPVRVGKTIFSLFDNEQLPNPFSSTEWLLHEHVQPEEMINRVQMIARDTEQEPRESELSITLDKIYNFQNTIAVIQSEPELYPKIVNALCNIIPNAAVSLLMYDIETGTFQPKATRGLHENPNEPIPENAVSIELVEHVKKTGESALFVGIHDTAVIAVPMRGRQQMNGIFYLAGHGSEFTKYRSEDLRILSILAYFAGMAVEYHKTVEINDRNERLIATGTTAAGLSHYIKNIMAGLDGCVNLLRIGIDENDQALSDEAWQILNKNHQRLTRVVLDLLNLSSEQQLNLTVYNINDLVKDVFDLYKDQLMSENIVLQIDSRDTAKPLLAEIDPKGIHRILLNLVNNAEHAVLSMISSTEDQFQGHISISAALNQTGNQLLLTVTDNGVGIEPNEIKNIFDLFISSKGNAGTGLGLAVCKRIAEAHGGTIAVSSVKGAGCVFTVTLPVTHEEMNTSTCMIGRIKA